MWAAGTGYSSKAVSYQDGPVWDAAASELAQRARDEELRLLLESLVVDVARDLKLELESEALGGKFTEVIGACLF